jgi:hypothetical protein
MVARRDLDKLYPTAVSAAASPPEPARRKPGPETKHDWPIHVAIEVIRIIRAGERMPTAAKMAQHCEDTLGFQPDIREMQRLLRRLLG